MEATRSGRSSFIDQDDPKMRDVELVDNTTASEQDTGKGESSAAYQVSCPQDIPEKSEAASRAGDDMEMLLRKKIYECGVRDMRIPELRMSGCSDCEETESDDDDICSSSSDDSMESYNPLASGVMPPVLPDIQLRVPMEDEDDVRRVRASLMIKGVLDVVCDKERQIVTVTGIVPPSRLLKKVRKVKRQARIISTISPFAAFVNPNFSSSAFALQDEEVPRSNAIDIPSAHTVPNFTVHQQRPRPTFQRYNFRNDPHSPYLRTFSPSDLSPPDSLSYVHGDGFDHHRRFDSSLFDDDSYQDNEFILI